MDVKKAGAVLLIPVGRIRTNPNQPRKHFDSAELASLGESIRRNRDFAAALRARTGRGRQL